MAILSKLPLLLLAVLLVTLVAGAPTRHVATGEVTRANVTAGSSSSLIHDERFLKKLGRGLKKAAKSVGKGIKKATRGVKKGIKKAARGAKKGIKKAGRAVSKVVKGIGKAAAHAAVCNPASKAGFATAFAAAVAAPAPHCRSMTASEWRRVGCNSPSRHRRTRICAPAVWGGVLGKIIKANAMALKTKVIFRKGITRSWLFNTSRGRALVRHELTHIRQQDGVGSYKWGYRYITAYCKVGRSYYKNKFEVEARRFQNDIC